MKKTKWLGCDVHADKSSAVICLWCEIKRLDAKEDRLRQKFQEILKTNSDFHMKRAEPIQSVIASAHRLLDEIERLVDRGELAGDILLHAQALDASLTQLSRAEETSFP